MLVKGMRPGKVEVARDFENSATTLPKSVFSRRHQGASDALVTKAVFDAQRRPVERLVAWYLAEQYHHHVHLTRKAAR